MFIAKTGCECQRPVSGTLLLIYIIVPVPFIAAAISLTGAGFRQDDVGGVAHVHHQEDHVEDELPPDGPLLIRRPRHQQDNRQHHLGTKDVTLEKQISRGH